MQPILGAPYLTRSLCTADLSTPLRSGRDDKVGVIANQTFLNPIFISLGGPQAHEHSVENHPGKPALPAVVVSHPCCARMGHPKSLLKDGFQNTLRTEGAPYLTRSLRQMWDSTNLDGPRRGQLPRVWGTRRCTRPDLALAHLTVDGHGRARANGENLFRLVLPPVKHKRHPPGVAYLRIVLNLSLSGDLS